MASAAGALIALGAGALGLYALTKSKGGAPEPIGPEVTVVGPSGKTWNVVPMNRNGDNVSLDIWAPAGAWGPHAKMRILRYDQKGEDKSTRTYIDSPPGIPKAMMDTAILDFGVKIPFGKVINVSGARVAGGPAGNCRHARWVKV